MKLKNILVLALVTLVFWQIILPSVNSLNLPLDKNYGIISRLVIDGRSPLTNYAIYLILFLCPSFIILGFLFLRGQSKKLNLNFKFNLLLISIISNYRFLPIALFLAIVCWLLNTKHQPMIGSKGSFAQEGFHFGEVVGLSGTFLQNPGWFYNKAYLMIHGFGLNVLPGFIGLSLGKENRDIAISGLVVDIHYTIATIFAFLIMLEIAAYISLKSKWKIFSLFILVYFSLHNIALASLDRDVIFLIQVFLSLRWMRLELNEGTILKSNYQIIYPVLLGFSIPVSFLYVYDRATYFVFLFIYLLAYFLVVKGIKFVLTSGLLAFASIAAICLIFSGVFGFSYLPVTFKQISYWSKYSGIFTGLAYPKINIKFAEIQNWLAIFLQSCCLTLLCLKFHYERSTKGISIRGFLSKNGIEIFLLLCAIVTMRVALGRSQDWYLTSRGFFPIFSFLTVIIRFLIQRINSLPSFSSVFITVLLFCSLFNMNSVAAAANVLGMVKYPSAVKAILSKTNSELLNPSYLEVAKQIKDDLAGSCFYTLTSEGVWYRILSMRPCSKYWYLLYSTSTESQKELVRELQVEKPKLILYANQFWSNGIDGVSKETSHLLVHQYIWQNYRPYKMLNGNWFWIRRESHRELSDLLVPNSTKVVGSFDGLQSLDSNKKLDVLASGWSILGKADCAQNTVFITYSPVNSPNELKLLGAGLVSAERYDVATTLNSVSALHSGWNISFNKLNLPPEDVVLRAWAYNSEDYKLYEIPSASPKLVKGELPTAKRITP